MKRSCLMLAFFSLSFSLRQPKRSGRRPKGSRRLGVIHRIRLLPLIQITLSMLHLRIGEGSITCEA